MIRRHLGAYLSCLTVGLSLALLLSVAITPASAGSVIISVSGFDPENPGNEATSMSMDYPVAVNAEDDTFYYIGGFGDDTTPWEMEILHLSGDLDPFTDLNFTMKNNTLVTLQYIVSITLPTGPLGPSTLYGGSAGGSVTDANFSAGGATLSTIGGGVPFYRGVYDGGLILPIYPDPSSFSATTGATTNIPALTVGLNGFGFPTLPGPAVVATIGIVHEFTLTAGDSMGATSNFRVEIIPEPAACVLAICGLFATVRLRRRS
jgi:hypothetical protein